MIALLFAYETIITYHYEKILNFKTFVRKVAYAMNFLKRTWAEINLDHLAYNVKEIRKHLPESTRIMAVVKANAYGHGDRYIAKEIENLGVQDFGVSNLEEALFLRKVGIQGHILILGVTPASAAKKLSEHSITQTIYSLEYAQELNEAAKQEGIRIDCHIKLDTGMGRIGFFAGEDFIAMDDIASACNLSNLNVTGIFSHFSSSDDTSEEGMAYTQMQIKQFDSAVAALEEREIHFEVKHLQNSAGVLNYPNCRYNMARVGVILYGLPLDTLSGCSIPLKPVMSIRSAISMVKTVQKGDCISYSRRFTAPKELRLATVPIGYADGYLRAFSNKSKMIVNGHYAKVVGSICMDQLLLDVTDIPDVKAGDFVTVVGSDGDCQVTFGELADIAGTIHYELVCLVSRRVPRVYQKDGKTIGIVDYIIKE